MCGICGVVGAVDPGVLERMTDTMVHRGPDDRGLFCDEGIGLGVRRLSIIDVGGGHQPMCNEDATLTVVFNGEIYNYRELRRRLEGRGHGFATGSDTEVLLHLYEEYGDASVHLLEGMFAYALWDSRRRRLLLARDRLGIKPVYYATVGSAFLFASEAKALFEYPGFPAALNTGALDLYLALQYVPGPDTLFRGVHKLPPGHVLVAAGGRVDVRRYWELLLGDFQPGTTLDEAAEEFGATFRQAVQRHLVSDVPVGALLSGGVDSSAVVAMMARSSARPVETFTVGFELPGRHNEIAEAGRVARHFGTAHHELLIQPDAAGLLGDLMWHMDEPVADAAALPTYLVCRFARQVVPVALTGEGGDELLGGYPRYAWFALAQRLKRLLPATVRERVLLPLSRLAPLGPRYRRAVANLLTERDDVARHLQWVGALDPELRRQVVGPALTDAVPAGVAETRIAPYFAAGGRGAPDVLHRLMALDIHTWLVDDLLTKMDKMSMAASVEARVPFLDHRLVEFVASLPLRVKVKNVGSKLILKRAMHGIVPRATLRRRKHAFQVPLDQWVSGALRSFVRDILLDRRASERGWLDPKRLETLLARGAGRARYGQVVWTLVCLELWARAFFDGDRPRVAR
ncbi:MAG TPA: asparagine synthase (glutamine-hydrolyzing) [Gemmatimonadales bacterium]|jgi:asparagine synthase (glutamine-hydrolysing)|nr:asparagine synthase (glutamine-hydrolyzing) [Gemmatimonadales bacterium]